MRMGRTLALPTVAVLALAVGGCSSGGDAPKAEKLCDGAVGSAAETALEKLTGTSTPSSRMGSASRTPEELRKKALEWKAEGDPWKSTTTRWFCSVGDLDAEKSLAVGSSWSLVDFSYASKEIEKGSKKYLKISPDAIAEDSGNGRTDLYFPCQVSKGGATHTLEVDVTTDLATAEDAKSDVDKVLLSVARWMSGQVGCLNDPDVPSSAQF